MIPMTGDEEKLKHYITDVRREKDSLVIKYASSGDDFLHFSEHNLNVVRYRMIEQAKTYLNSYLDFIAKESFSTYVKKFAAIIGGIIAMFFFYNIDIHIIIKIILTILTLGFEAVYAYINKVFMAILGIGLDEALALEYYLNNINDFKYYNPETGSEEFRIPIEELSREGIFKEDLEEFSKIVQEQKKQGIEERAIKLIYKRFSKSKEEN